MVPFTRGTLVLIPFPFSDLSKSKLRPAMVLADAGKGDGVLCQITSNPYSDAKAISISDEDSRTGSLRVKSYARPGKLFTANRDLIVSHIGILDNEASSRTINAIIEILRSEPTPS